MKAATELAYAAALVDTLAVLKLRSIKSEDLPVVVINSVRYASAVQHLADLSGTKPIQVPKEYVHRGCNEHCPDKHNHVASVSLRWQLVGVRATIMLYNLLPFMRLQRDTALGLVRHGQTIGYKGNVPKEMAELGWNIPQLRPQPRTRLLALD